MTNLRRFTYFYVSLFAIAMSVSFFLTNWRVCLESQSEFAHLEWVSLLVLVDCGEDGLVDAEAHSGSHKSQREVSNDAEGLKRGFKEKYLERYKRMDGC